jgi:NAD(P)-dependent dehydrogenase (short-subunit alcohol dehydrogenase family)
MEKEQGGTPPPQHQERQPGRETGMRPRPDFMPHHRGSDRLAGKAALITGGDSGIGRAVAVLFAREGADVAISYLDEHQDAEETGRQVEAEGARSLSLAGDIGDPTFCEEVVERTVDGFGRLDVLVNNAGEQHVRESLEDVTPEALERVFRTNIFSVFLVTRAAVRHMGEGGAIVNSSSVTAFRGSATLPDYAATKGGIIALTRSLSSHLLDRGIRVNAVAPGPVWTPLIPASFPEERVEAFGTQTPMQRPAQPEEVAPSYLFLASDDSSYFTGQTLHPNGGELVGS